MCILVAGSIMIHNKKGAENVIASLILFIAVMALATTTTVIFKNYLDKSGGAVTAQATKSNDIIQTSFDVTIVTYNAGTTTAYVKNTGSTRFEPSDIDIYIDGQRVPRDGANRTIAVTSDTDTVNVGIWDPKEELEIQVFQTFSTSQTRTLTLATPNGVTTQEDFSS